MLVLHLQFQFELIFLIIYSLLKDIQIKWKDVSFSGCFSKQEIIVQPFFINRIAQLQIFIFNNIMENRQSDPEPTSTERPVKEAVDNKGNQLKGEFDWSLSTFDEQVGLKNLSRIADENLAIQIETNNSKLYIAQSTIKSLTLNKQFIYILRGQSEKTGKIQITRKYSDFYALRQALVKRWPGCFIPPIPSQGNIGATEKQVSRNKVHILSSFLNRMTECEPIFEGEEFQIFVKSNQNQVQKSLNALKPHNLQDLYSIYKTSWPQSFSEISQIDLAALQERVKNFSLYFSEFKKDLASQKDSIKRLAELRTKLTTQRYVVLSTSLPQYQRICLNWYFGKTTEDTTVQPQDEKKQGQSAQNAQDQKQEQIIEEKPASENLEGQIFTSPKYQGTLEAFKDELFPKEEGENEDWVIYQMFKFELLEIESMIQCITNYRYLLNEKRFFQRNIQGNKKQLEDINNKKISLKILLLSGNEDDKRTQLANELQLLQNKLKVSQDLWKAMTQHIICQLEDFQTYRCNFYKKNLMKAFKKEAIYKAKLFNFYLDIKKI